MNPKTLSRRRFLRAAGVTLALPLLESRAARAAEAAPPRRLFAANVYFGLHPESFFPEAAGRGYALTPYLAPLKDHRERFTVFSGLSHPDVGMAHDSAASFLTAAPHPGTPKYRNTISLDQLLVDRLDPKTRYPSLSLTTAPTGGHGLSVNRAGIRIPAEAKPSALFARLFLSDKADAKAQLDRLAEGRSVLDTVRDQAKRIEGDVSGADRGRLEQYFGAVRDVERRLQDAQAWVDRPKPKVEAAPPKDATHPGDVVGRARLMLDLAHLALQTDSTRYVTLMVYGDATKLPIDAITADYHGLSHHGNDPDKLKQLRVVEGLLMEALGGFLGKLAGTKEAGGTLLDNTAVLVGSNLGSGSSHSTTNLPVLVAGGGFRHGQHLAFDRKANSPLAKLYVSLLYRSGCEVDAFGGAKGRLTGFEVG